MPNAILKAIAGMIYAGYAAEKMDEKFKEIDANPSIPPELKDAQKVVALTNLIPGFKSGKPSSASELSSLANTDPATRKDISDMLGNTPDKIPQDPNGYAIAVGVFIEATESIIKFILDYKWAILNPIEFLDGLRDYYLPEDGIKLSPDWLKDILDRFQNGEATGSPLVIDMDGDGIELSALNGAGAAYFDIDNDGFAEASGWVKGGDALLVTDRNNNGKIDNQSELFGIAIGG